MSNVRTVLSSSVTSLPGVPASVGSSQGAVPVVMAFFEAVPSSATNPASEI